MDTNTIKSLEDQLPGKLRHWLSDALANGESIGDMGDELLGALRERYQWTRENSRYLVNQLMAAYDCDQRFLDRHGNE